mgnify:FL=1|tara:strand:+ start:376 stop:591 length:216 start_codon:yes stop_codon:yes gene_type:complete
MKMETYTIVRFFQRHYNQRVIATGLTLEEAQAHCKDPETSSRTATEAAGVRRTRDHGNWFDGMREEKNGNR